MILAYVAGKLRANTPEEYEANILQAEAVGREVAKLGYVPVVPHSFARSWKLLGWPEEKYLEMDFALMEPCQLLVLVSNWQTSTFTPKEVAHARENGLPVYMSVDDVPPACQFQTDCVTDLIADIQARRRTGVSAYGVPLRPHNGRKALMDAYEEVLDLSAYLRQELTERQDVV